MVSWRQIVKSIIPEALKDEDDTMVTGSDYESDEDDEGLDMTEPVGCVDGSLVNGVIGKYSG